MKILAIETSFDETSVAIVEDGVRVHSCVISSSMDMHAKTGGAIPENAARKQVEYMIPALNEALAEAHCEDMNGIDAIGVTVGPGLIGSLLVGVETAKTLAAVFNKPLIPVNHVKAHVYGTFLSDTPPQFPLVAIIVSGGHTDFVYMSEHGQYEWVGGTRDDAAGECFDKCGRILGLGYPGGPAVAKAAQIFLDAHPTTKLHALPRPMAFDDTNDVSFSGLKTAMARLVKQNEVDHTYSTEQLAAELQEAIIDTLINKTKRIIQQRSPRSVVLCGGVSANVQLKSRFLALQKNELASISIHVPDLKYSTDNAAMIGSYAFFNYHPENPDSIAPNPELHF